MEPCLACRIVAFAIDRFAEDVRVVTAEAGDFLLARGEGALDETHVQGELGDVLEAIGQKTNTPVLLDYAKIESRGLDVTSVSVTVEKRRYAWASLLTRITSPSFLTTKICCDEARKPFVWVTPLKNTGSLPRRKPAKPAAQAPLE